MTDTDQFLDGNQPRSVTQMPLEVRRAFAERERREDDDRRILKAIFWYMAIALVVLVAWACGSF